MLVDDYASGECRTHSDWSSAMLLSIGKLQKRLGEEHTKSLQYHLDAGQYETVAEGLLDYYDVLYDTHLGEQRPEKKTLAQQNIVRELVQYLRSAHSV